MAELSKKEKRRAERQAAKEQKQKEKEKHRRATTIRRLSLYLIGLLLLTGAGYWAYGKWSATPIGEFVPSKGNRHTSLSQVGLTTYTSDPPTSGPHLPSIARWGIQTRPISKELQVHNLEDGGVIVQYDCPEAREGCRALVEKLARIVRRYDHAILAPYPRMSHKIAITAWSRIDKFNEFDEERIVRFIDAYIDIDHHPRRGR
ncbi:MAG: DUF3105 domain-containing protein [Deltaproteobacteria bacterium]|nr:DUF3105 domain-containing protein [Deltaproteobacteria bacterium]